MISAWGLEMPKKSQYAIALGLHAPLGPPTHRDRGRCDRAVAPRSIADGFYFQLEAFIDSRRRQGLTEDVVRTGLERAKHASLAMENVGKLLKGQ
jgi:hypothetical protein